MTAPDMETISGVDPRTLTVKYVVDSFIRTHPRVGIAWSCFVGPRTCSLYDTADAWVPAGGRTR